MYIKRKRGWELPESAATAEAVYLNRREFAKGLAAGPVLLALGAGGFGAGVFANMGQAQAADADPSAKLYPFKRNDTYKLDRPLTPEEQQLPLAAFCRSLSPPATTTTMSSARARTSPMRRRHCRSAPGR